MIDYVHIKEFNVLAVFLCFQFIMKVVVALILIKLSNLIDILSIKTLSVHSKNRFYVTLWIEKECQKQHTFLRVLNFWWFLYWMMNLVCPNRYILFLIAPTWHTLYKKNTFWECVYHSLISFPQFSSFSLFEVFFSIFNFEVKKFWKKN